MLPAASLVIMKDGTPWWIPPAHIDPERKLIRNTTHYGLPELDAALEPA